MDVVTPHPWGLVAGLAPQDLQAAGALDMIHLALIWDAALVRLSTAENICASGSQASLGGGCFLLLLWDFQDTQSSAFGLGLWASPGTQH